MSSPPINISHRLFRCRYSISRDLVASSCSCSCPIARAPWNGSPRACLLATNNLGKWANGVSKFWLIKFQPKWQSLWWLKVSYRKGNWKCKAAFTSFWYISVNRIKKINSFIQLSLSKDKAKTLQSDFIKNPCWFNYLFI